MNDILFVGKTPAPVSKQDLEYYSPWRNHRQIEDHLELISEYGFGDIGWFTFSSPLEESETLIKHVGEAAEALRSGMCYLFAVRGEGSVFYSPQNYKIVFFGHDANIEKEDYWNLFEKLESDYGQKRFKYRPFAAKGMITSLLKPSYGEMHDHKWIDNFCQKLGTPSAFEENERSRLAYYDELFLLVEFVRNENSVNSSHNYFLRLTYHQDSPSEVALHCKQLLVEGFNHESTYRID
ncbi:hypothetical protein [Cerasicoccus maritimus]|uniref:hypothetical protein n=1 Tax=Cerasicoccus maritimus TaxID=490089 RepID=UPI0028524D26|nr:hypothetical protein [Cerasicoccus maritimus]